MIIPFLYKCSLCFLYSPPPEPPHFFSLGLSLLTAAFMSCVYVNIFKNLDSTYNQNHLLFCLPLPSSLVHAPPLPLSFMSTNQAKKKTHF